MVASARTKPLIHGLLYVATVQFVCLHRSLSTLLQSHKFRSRCSTLSWSPNFSNPGVEVPQKMRTPHPCMQHSAMLQ